MKLISKTLAVAGSASLLVAVVALGYGSLAPATTEAASYGYCDSEGNCTGPSANEWNEYQRHYNSYAAPNNYAPTQSYYPTSANYYNYRNNNYSSNYRYEYSYSYGNTPNYNYQAPPQYPPQNPCYTNGYPSKRVCAKNVRYYGPYEDSWNDQYPYRY